MSRSERTPGEYRQEKLHVPDRAASRIKLQLRVKGGATLVATLACLEGDDLVGHLNLNSYY